ncbi:MAG: LLM class flavin-dependent oxidoreductase [Chloroflexi bacterium]|nr:LLM class flavin-dependent oxidoreductase [Chloroflexota bacterium]
MPKIDADIWQDLTYADYVYVAKLAEDHGFENFWLIDSTDAYDDYCAWDSLVAINTSRMRIGPNVTNPLTRHPRVTANHMLTLHELSKGRAILGIGAGDNAVRSMGEKPASASVLREAVEIIRAKFKERKADIPIHVAAVAPLNTKMALQLADGIMGGVGGGTTAEGVSTGLQRLKDRAKEVGRDFGTLKVEVAVQFAVSHNRKEALEEMKGPVSAMMKGIFVQRSRTLPPELERFREEAKRAGEAYDYFDHLRSYTREGKLARHAQLVSDELVEAAGMLAGTPQEVLPRMKAIWQAISPFPNVSLAFRPRGVRAKRKRSFDLLVKEILPKLK